MTILLTSQNTRTYLLKIEKKLDGGEGLDK